MALYMSPAAKSRLTTATGRPTLSSACCATTCRSSSDCEGFIPLVAFVPFSQLAATMLALQSWYWSA